ncbi:MAG: hypothetical protein A2V70_15735 [Planctomycetes bacterium RBG_13_63_9]|nr:MAG: hypothetical protein A2V70_15735 [Planctomycetes bacterium RBG_13_63_9]
MKPVLQALVLAERVYTDITGKKIIAGTFNRVQFTRTTQFVQERQSPSGETKYFVRGGVHGGSPYAYISLTDVVDNTQLTLQFVNLTKNVVILEQQLTVQCDGRLQTIEIVAPLPPLPVCEAGVYAFEVVCEEAILGSHRVIAEELQDPEELSHGDS